MCDSSHINFRVILQQGVPGDAVPWPEREVSSLLSLFPRLPLQAAQGRYPSSYTSAIAECGMINELNYGPKRDTKPVRNPIP